MTYDSSVEVDSGIYDHVNPLPAHHDHNGYWSGNFHPHTTA